MKKSHNNPNKPNNEVDVNILGYPTYPATEDIYNKYKEDKDVKPENTNEVKDQNDDGVFNEKEFKDDFSGNDLDIPGSELDNNQENIGSEDEENNYYSIGGDNHNDLDESKGDF
ncbi:MAG: hypothetical protein WCP69_12235 [Bacteroidota bacterium]